MLTVLTLAGSLFVPSCHERATEAPAPASVVQTRPDKRVLSVLSTWMKTYRKGNWDLTADASRRGDPRGGQPGRQPGSSRGGQRNATSLPKFDDYLVVKNNLLPDDYVGSMDFRIEIGVLCRLARDLGTVEAARAVLEVAAVGLDTKVRYTSRMAPTTVREIGEAYLRRFDGIDVVAFLAAAAAGETGGDSSYKTAMQAAALRGLGVRKSSVHRSVIIAQLASTTPMVRAAAAHALGRLQEAYSIKPLAERLPREGDATVLIEIVTAIDSIRAPLPESAVKLEHMQMAVIEVGRALGRADSWRPDLALVDFLGKYRYKASIPLLIQFLERWDKEPQKVKSNRLSSRLQVRVHEVLISLTGARIPMTPAARWREFWTTNQSTFELATAAEKATQDPRRTGGGFFNIPIQGKRVVFVIDRSGSMEWPMVVTNSSGPTVAGGGKNGNQAKKITIAKRELWKAIQGLPVDAKFNVIWYNADPVQWKTKLVPATERNKASFKVALDGLRAVGATNIYDSMKMALKMKSLVYGQHYDSNVDEVFLLSDGSPTAGEVIQPNEILRIITETNKFSRVRINTVYLEGDGMGGPGGGRGGGRGGFGGRGGGNGDDLMRQIAAKNGGKFVKP